MKSKSLILASVMAFSFTAPTMASDWFIGGAVGTQKDKYEVNSSLEGKSSDKENDAVYQVRAGKYLNDNHRVYGTYSYNSDDFATQQSFLMSYDYLVNLGQSNKLNWFIGATAGLNHTSPDHGDLRSKDDFVWGAQTGFNFQLTKNMSTELGYRYLKQDYGSSITNGTESTKFGLDNTQQVYFGIDYRF
ncbi:outer membrane beta-barrel protein [Shewanella gelidii]|uniref:PhoP/Q and low Mg2+ inducible outer membrane protein H1 n=1 Tax=Shewanella gelidii TaxID=1642821 RepID=A0A917NBD5_9GAMM|nr:outer membrane beta-barrel protein [Shewanella gelidii]MCL1097570.1 porin family protein [Shewanella gelidii]GGI80559.1 PhoP/Q and low Mg2+ inducible outer membrane protein H1 [Shewanella gelidii]